jgi:hypothetical protein
VFIVYRFDVHCFKHMLYPHLLSEALQKQREDFVRFGRLWQDNVHDYARRLRALNGRTAQEVSDAALKIAKEPGALPSIELERFGSMIVPFDERWRTHEEARWWAIDALYERTTFAADGSQLLPGREISVPVAAVQVAWFENAHTREGRYQKGARLHIITPRELLESSRERLNPENVVNYQRFKLETEALAEFIERKKDWRAKNERAPVAFFDGTLLISFAQPQIQTDYINTIVNLIKASREAKVPLIGYVDQSYARDLVWLLETLAGNVDEESSRALNDAQLLCAFLRDEAGQNAWGGRTSFCYCLRKNLSRAFTDENGRPLIGFTYLQTTSEGAPARLDIPVWVYEENLLDEVIDAVRAECISGLGYPYVIETADAAALITTRDRQHFLRVIQDFADHENLTFRLSRKAASKVRRR